MKKKWLRSIGRYALYCLAVMAVGIIIAWCYGVWHYCLRTSYSAPAMSVSYASGGTPNAVTFDVRDNNGQPVPGISVLSEDWSGWVHGMTDAKGSAVNVHTSGEATCLAVEIAGQQIEFRPGIGNQDLLSPDLSAGVVVTVVLTK